MPRNKKAATSNTSNDVRPVYVPLGRGVLFSVNSENDKAPLYKGFVGIEGFAFVELTIFPPKEGASEKVIGSGFAKQRPGKDEPVLFYVTLLESSGDYDNSPGYALCNIPKANRDRNAPPDLRISMFYNDDDTSMYDLKISGLLGVIDELAF